MASVGSKAVSRPEQDISCLFKSKDDSAAEGLTWVQRVKDAVKIEHLEAEVRQLQLVIARQEKLQRMEDAVKIAKLEMEKSHLALTLTTNQKAQSTRNTLFGAAIMMMMAILTWCFS